MRLALFFCPKARTGGETWQKSSKVEGRLQTPGKFCRGRCSHRPAVHYPICSPQSFGAYPALRADDEHRPLQTLCNVCSDKQGFSTAGGGHPALQIFLMFAASHKKRCRERSRPFRQRCSDAYPKKKIFPIFCVHTIINQSRAAIGGTPSFFIILYSLYLQHPLKEVTHAQYQ